MKTSELSLSAFLMMLLTLVARCRVQLNPVINPFSPFYCPPLITPTLNYTHNPTARPACGVIHASVHLCCTIYSLFLHFNWNFEKQTPTKLFGSCSNVKELSATSISPSSVGSGFKKWAGYYLSLFDSPLCLLDTSVVCEVQNIGWFCLTVSVCSCAMQKVCL